MSKISILEALDQIDWKNPHLPVYLPEEGDEIIEIFDVDGKMFSKDGRQFISVNENTTIEEVLSQLNYKKEAPVYTDLREVQRDNEYKFSNWLWKSKDQIKYGRHFSVKK